MDFEGLYPTKDDGIEPDKAKFLYENHCAIFVLENLPVNSEFGIDLAVYRTGEKFRGVKLIPPGVHFIFASACEKNSQQLGPRNGFYYEFKIKELVVRRWSQQDEEFDDTFTPHEDYKQRYTSNLRDLDRYLGLYKFSTYSTYLNLTNKLTWSLVQDLMPKCNKIRSVPYLVRDETSEDSSKSTEMVPSPTDIGHHSRHQNNDNNTEKGMENLLPDLKPSQDSVIRFAPIPGPNEIRQYLDAGDYRLIPFNRLEHAFKGQEGKTRLLGELQFAFVTLILGHVYDCFERWAQLLELICRSADEGLEHYAPFYVAFVDVLRFQLDQMPEELFVDEESSLSKKNLVSSILEKFFNSVEYWATTTTTVGSDQDSLLIGVRQLRTFAESKFGWQFVSAEEVDDENAPVIV